MPAIPANLSVYVPQRTEDIVLILGSFIPFAYPSVGGMLSTVLSLFPASLSSMVYTGVEVCKIDSEMSGLVE